MEPTKFVLVKLDYCQPDEFDINAFWVTTERQFTNFIEKINEIDWAGKEIYFGTNEWIEFEESEELIEALSVTYITEEFANQLVAHFGETYGLIDISCLTDYID